MLPNVNVEVGEGKADDEAALTGAEFRTLRECLGLTQETLARLLGVQIRTLQRVETGGHRMPPGLANELLGLQTMTLGVVEEEIRRLADDAFPTFLTYRNDDEYTGPNGPEQYREMGSAWHRHVGCLIRQEIPGVRIMYALPYIRPLQ